MRPCFKLLKYDCKVNRQWDHCSPVVLVFARSSPEGRVCLLSCNVQQGLFMTFSLVQHALWDFFIWWMPTAQYFLAKRSSSEPHKHKTLDVNTRVFFFRFDLIGTRPATEIPNKWVELPWIHSEFQSISQASSFVVMQCSRERRSRWISIPDQA